MMHTDATAPRMPQNGFTLIEMLVTLVILGMLAGLILSGLGMGGAQLRRMRSESVATDEVLVAQARLRNTIERLLPENAAPGIVDVRGTDHDFAFFAPPQRAEAPDAVRRYRLLLSATGDLALYQASSLDRRIDLNSPDLVGWRPIELLRNVAQINLAYYGPEHDGIGNVWQPSWITRAQPPQLVRVHVEFAAGDSRRWPDLIVRTLASAEAACAINPRTGRCANGAT